MIRKLLFLFIAIVTTQLLFSEPVDREKAILLAKEFYQKQNNSRIRSNNNPELTLAYACKDTQLRSQEEKAYYYIFNRTDKEGFIIISGDDRAKTVLGYSDNSNYDPENLPENFQYLLSYYKEAMNKIMEENTPKKAIDTTPGNFVPEFDPYINPLLNNIAWNQGSPYNYLCPMDGRNRSVTGCVATAMAQIMRYHKWPEQGQGNKTYKTGSLGIELTVDFSQSIYDWENMKEVYGNSYSDAERDAVARLMYDCGVSIDMNYTSYASGAYSEGIPYALVNYFGYDENVQMHYRQYYTNEAWIRMIKFELNQRRPIYISGYSANVGHAFVCDGYDTDNLFHINWGWGGISNGYFEIATLNPDEQGIGGGGDGGYNRSLIIITGIQKPTESSVPSYNIYLDNHLSVGDNTSLGREETFSTESTQIINNGANNFNGEVGVGIFKDNELVNILTSNEASIASGRRLRQTWKDITLPSDLENGTYRLYALYKASGESYWQKIGSESNIANCLDILLSEDSIKIFTPADARSILSVPENGFEITPLYFNKKAKFNLTIDNLGKEAYTTIYIVAQNIVTEEYYYLSQEDICLNKDEQISLEYSRLMNDLPVGDYYIMAMYESGYYLITLEGDSFHVITVNGASLEPAELSLAGKITINQSSFVKGETASITTSVTNTGGYYFNDIYAYMYRTNLLSSSGSDVKEIMLQKNDTVNIQFDIPITQDTGEYYIQLRYRNESNRIIPINDPSNHIELTIVDPTGIDKNISDNISIYPNPAEDYLVVQSNVSIKALHIVNISGKRVYTNTIQPIKEISIPVSQLASGVYFLQIETDNKTIVKKFIKR